MEEALERYLHQNIPLSRAMDVRVESVSPVTLLAPLLPNLNHRGTGFGGSLVSVATLAGWGWVWLQFEAPRPRIVIARANMDFLAPAEADFTATVLEPEVTPFRETLLRRGKAKIRLTAEVRAGVVLVGRFTGDYVVLADSGGS